QEVTFKLETCEINADGSATCSIIKDAGDDPDCTDKAELTATVRLLESDEILLIGGKGVATVTQAGLGLEIGTPAINPVPRKNITEMVQLELELSKSFSGAEVTISVPGGERMAKETMNERLGLIGGISILGTTGIVRPYSTAAFRASIVQAINLAMHLKFDQLVFTTGGKSEQYAMEILNQLKVESFIQVGDFIGSSLKSAKKAGIHQVNIVGMMGKLSKMADGQTQTHMAGSSVNIPMLADIAASLGASEQVREEILKANTARHVLEICGAHGLEKITEELCKKVVQVMTDFVGGALRIDCYLVDFNGKLMASVKGID
ncbi:MAG: cobalt-precorrin-5B (C(1))-methyltransferase, partial [Lentisphaeraceae bacterium]|nr:cobalt-precorrin-5B (C(1))-methyltransferase [Lentisphaeraceae bacterium]